VCGIAGWVRASRAWDRSTLKGMMDAISHRGPDGEGAHCALSPDGAQVALGHRRLAIIDPAGGHQPMFSQDGKAVLTFNGEIYNFREIREELVAAHGHKFRTNSDSEVLLAAYTQWGSGCLSRLRGMFAFAIWDELKAALFLARDPFGKKPLFILRLPDGIAFASEIKSLLSLPGYERRLNAAALKQYLLFRYVLGPRTFFDGIEKLRPGCFGVYAGKRFREERYFIPPELTEDTIAISDADAVAEYGRLFEESVRLRLVSDVPFGAFLSGGLDSSAIVAAMSRNLSQPVRTFSVGFDAGDADELPYAKRVAQHFGTEHREVMIKPEDIISQLGPTIRALDAPVSEPATIPLLLLSRAAAENVKMVLSGEGADEFLGGYAKHGLERFAPMYQRLPGAVDRLLRAAVSTLPRRYERPRRALDSLAERDTRLRYPLWFAAFPRAELRALAASNGAGALDLDRIIAKNAPLSPLRALLLFDQTSWLPDNLLERGDRVSMAASLEVRMPFMDRELAAFSARLPNRMRIRGLTGKWLLRRAMRQTLPREILKRPKRGFPVPLAEWFRGSLYPMLTDVLLDRKSLAAGLLGRRYVEDTVAGHRAGTADATKPIWLMLNLNLFCDAYRLGA
jgi:asparagine synthase (glutamine-hydrolysing)